MEKALIRWAGERGYQVAWGPVQAVADAAAGIASQRTDGELDESFYSAELAWLARGKEAPVHDTVVVVAVPRPAHRVHFELEEGPFPALLPPTYFRYRSVFEDVRQDLARDGLPGARVEHLSAPLKSVAARLGLVRYGRNNVTYAARSGSYIQLCGFLTDADLPLDRGTLPREPALLDECLGCGACAAACPSAAIDDQRVLISAHRCMTFANETEGAWPHWAPAWAHTCLLGCLECQKACPVNPELTVEETGVTFSLTETRTLLADDEGGSRVESGIRAKLAWLGQSYSEPVVGRNLRALLAASDKAKTRGSG